MGQFLERHWLFFSWGGKEIRYLLTERHEMSCFFDTYISLTKIMWIVRNTRSSALTENDNFITFNMLHSKATVLTKKQCTVFLENWSAYFLLICKCLKRCEKCPKSSKYVSGLPSHFWWIIYVNRIIVNVFDSRLYVALRLSNQW